MSDETVEEGAATPEPKKSRKGVVIALVVIVVLAVGAFALLNKSGDDVPWDDYAPGVKARIDRMADAGDCAGLQEEFDTADANGDATMNRTGHNNAALMGYIDSEMSDAGCYG